MIGERSRVLVPDDVVVQSRATHVRRVFDTQVIGEANGQDQVNTANAEAFCSAITALSDALAAERARVEQLLRDLADARAAERISADWVSHAPDNVTAEPVGTDPLTAIGIQTLSQAVEMLREDLAIANSSLLSERERAETERQDARRRMDELQRRIDGLHTDLADARTAAMIAGSEAAALRAQADERRSWRLLRRLRWALRAASEWR
jgi:predicted nucleic acid-binding protein